MTRPKRALADAREMRALAHPVRVALLELLGRDGPMTATQAGDVLGESPANTSFHLRTLAKYGFVEEAPGGTGRQRPWQRVAQAHTWDSESDDPATAAAAEGLSRFFDQRIVERRATWQVTRASYPKAWRDASMFFSSITYLTAAELEAVGEEIVAIIDRYSDRVPDRAKRPDGALPVALVATGHPIEPTPAGNRFHPVGDPVQDVLAAVAARVPVDERERASIERILAEVPRLDRPFDRHADPVHVTGSTLIVGRRGIVLLHHKSLGIWVQPGGHIDDGELPWEAAVREAIEETGLPVRLLDDPPQLAHVDVHAGSNGHTHLDLRYVVEGGDADPLPPPEESQQVAWFDWPDALAIADPGLSGLLPTLVGMR